MLIIGGVVLLHVALLFALRAAMEPVPMTRSVESTPLQITFIERRAAPTQPASRIPPPIPHLVSRPQQSVPRADALQAVTIKPRVMPSPGAAPPNALLYDTDGAVHMPAAPVPPKRDPFSRQSASRMLPGSDRAFAPGLHVREGGSPQKTVEAIGALLFGGGHYDPCEELETDLLGTGDPRLRDMAEERYERACPGR